MKIKLVLFFPLLVIARAGIVPRLLGGEDADPHDFPNIASLKGYKTDWRFSDILCAGAVANPWWILITANCALEIGIIYPKEHVTVEVGRWKLYNWEPLLQSRNISGAYAHEKFNPLERLHPFDLALVKVIEALEIHSHVKAIPISQNVSYPSGWVIMAGWGSKTRDELSNKKFSNILQVLNGTVFSTEQCIKLVEELCLKRHEILVSNAFGPYLFCTDNSKNSQGSAAGDSGGPVLQKNHLGVYELVGIIVSGTSSLENDGPIFHTHVPPLVGWIESTMAKHTTAQA